MKKLIIVDPDGTLTESKAPLDAGMDSQGAAVENAANFDPDFGKRQRMKAELDRMIPEFSVHLGGTTLIDITKPGIDKGYGIHKLRDLLGTAISEMIFIGDVLFPGGNYYPAKQAAVVSSQVRDSGETQHLIETILACSSSVSRIGLARLDVLEHLRTGAPADGEGTKNGGSI